MRKLFKAAFVVQFGFLATVLNGQSIVRIPNVEVEAYLLNVSWVHVAPGVTALIASDVRVYNPTTDRTETLGAVRLKITGGLTDACAQLAGQSASGNAQLTIYTLANSSRFEIQDVPTYIIANTNVRSCGLKKNK